ncbi:TonB-dependent receptor [Flavobacterium arcticum]|uniref:TonB-dependent receptor n=1 Tax=Flavobacterium arcticum TaxID=1784713 RepID=A0A345HEL3_9FLAO|nr:outer membrane beta-barrel family protein [Flavobacterium arcticum]AXG75023.1 TonB-dependent receptor [Flavobacterium arcticum]KAF2506575.1 TonB-dependent receptor [Flavobacterium arcticum]
MKYCFSVLFLVSSFTLFSQNETVNDSIKEMNTELDVLVLEKKKQAVERKADRTIFDFSEQAYLNSGSLLEGLKKLPGLIISDVAGMLYQGKQLQVYMDGRPLNIYSNELNTYLEGLPANAIEKVEIITNPGAEFPATSGGAIINIISSKKAKKYLSATYSNGYSYTNYDKSRHRFNNSLTLSAANKLFSWQIQAGQSYTESYRKSKFTSTDAILSENYSDRTNRFYYLKTGLKFDFRKDRLLVNYDINTNNNRTDVDASGSGFTSNDKSKSKGYYHDVMLTYQKRFDDPFKKLNFRFNYNNNDSDFNLNSRINQNPVLDNNSNQDFYQFKTDYSQQIDFLDNTKISAGALADRLDFDATSFNIKNLEYTRTSLAAYTEVQALYKQFEFIVGGRLESYDIEGNTDTDNLIPFNQTRFFPNATIQYKLTSQIYFKTNYNKKISLPNTASLNPNNTRYQNPNIGYFGNPNLEPTIFNNYEIEVNAYEYFFIGYSITNANNQITDRVISTENGAASISENIPDATIRNFNFGIPIPYMLFTKGLKKTLQFDFNPDEINFLYVYVGNQMHNIPNVDTKSIWNINLMSQIILPKKIKFVASYNTSNVGGNHYYYKSERPINERLDLTFSKKFLSDNLSVSLYVNDILNTNKQKFSIVETDFIYNSSYDSRRVGFSLSYKIPSKNKLAKEEGNILNDDIKQGENSIGN